MGKKQFPTGIRPHGEGIQIRFKLKHEKRYTHETINWQPTPANLEKAGKWRETIVNEIRHGTFRYSKHFPNSKNLSQLSNTSFEHYAQAWLDSPENNWKSRTRYKYKTILNAVWMPFFYEHSIQSITKTKLLNVIAEHMRLHEEDKGTPLSASTYNDWLTCIRGTFRVAIDDGVISRDSNPIENISNKTRPKPECDPFDVDEALAIIDSIYKYDGKMWGAFFEFGFFSGMRYPSEPAGLMWPDIEWRKKIVHINRARNANAKTGYEEPKTGKRKFDLNEYTLHALKVAKKISGFKDEFVFVDKNYQPIITAKPQRNMWKAALKRLGIRYRNMYNMRHTFSTFGIMNDMNPAYLAKQNGHSVEEFFKTYATWINSSQADRQKELMQQAIDRIKPKDKKQIFKFKKNKPGSE